MNRAACLLAVLIAIGSMFAPTARAETDSTASEIAALRRELKDLAVRNQHQIDTLQHQVRELSAELAKTRRGRAAAAAAPAGPVAAAEPQPGAFVQAATPPVPPAGHPPAAPARPPAAAGPREPEVIVGRQPPGLPPAPAAGVHVLETGPGRFGIESVDGRNAIFLTGRLHFDIGDYLNYKPGSKFAAVQDLNSGVNARRARIGVIARFMRDWDFNLIYDLGGSGDGFPPDPGALVSGLENALLTYSGLKNHGVPLVFDLGYMDVPFSQEESTSSNDIPLVERAAIINVATNIFANDFRSAFGVRSFSDRYWAGAYVTGPTSGTNHTTGEQLGAFGRAGYNILYSPEGFFHLEADVGALLKPPAPGGVRSITLSDRPETRVDPNQILSTGGALGTAANPLMNVEVYGGGGIAEWRNFAVDGEA